MGRKVKTFLHVFIRSLIPEVSYYRKIIRTQFCFSFKYFISLIIVINLFFILFVSVKLNPLKISTILTNLTKSLQAYPNKLNIEIKNGRLTTTYDRPYFLWLDYNNQKYLLLVIDESATPEKIKEYRSYMLLTSKYAVVKNAWYGGKTSLHSFKNFKNQRITKDTMNEVNASFMTIIRFLPIVYIGIVLLSFILLPALSFIVTSLYLFAASVLIYAILKYGIKKQMRFEKILQVSFHAITFPLVIDYSLIAFNLSSKPLPLLFLFLVIVFVAGGIYEAYFDHEDDRKTPSHLHHN